MDRLPQSPPHFRRTTRTTIKRNGERKVRTIDEPDDEARKFHASLLADLYRLKIDMPNATGGIPSRSLVDNMRPHADNQHFYMLDIWNAFPSVNGDRLAKLLSRFWTLGDEPAIHRWLDEYCLDPQTNGLILGAPTSPYLFNIYCREMDRRIQTYCVEKHLTYTRYFDDITLSCPASYDTIGVNRSREIRNIILSEGWGINHRKSQRHNLENGPITVTGISLYPDGHWRLSPALVREIIGVFSELESEIKSCKGYISEEDRGRLHGYYGVLTSTYDDRRGHPTAIETQLIRKYKELRAQVKQTSRTSGRAATKQVAFFNPGAYRAKPKDGPDIEQPVVSRGPRSEYKTEQLFKD